jgi:hypothetical protein
MQENLREFSKKIISAVKTVLAKAPGGIAPFVMLFSVGIIALTQESPFQVNDFTADNEKDEQDQDFSSGYELERKIPEWVKPARWFRSNSGGMPLEEMQSRIAAMRGQYALVIDFTSPIDLPEHLQSYYDDRYFIEVRTLYKGGNENRTQWIFRDENYGVRLIAVLFEASAAAQEASREAAQNAAQDTDDEKIEDAPVEENAADVSDKVAVSDETTVIQNAEDGNIEITGNVEIAELQGDIEDSEIETKVSPVIWRGPASGFIEIYDEKYHITAEYRYTDKGERSKIEYFYNNGIKTSARTMLWDDKDGDYIQTHTDYYRYNRSAFLRAVERVFMRDQQITSSDNVVTSNEVADNVVKDNIVKDNVVKVSFPHNILAVAKNDSFMGEKFNSYPDFFDDLFVLKDSKLVFTTDERGRVLDQTLINNDEEKTVIWKIVNTWSDDRIVKITKTEGQTVLLTEYVYNKDGDRVLERNIKNGVLERVVRSEGKTDIEELYLNNKVVLQAVWEDGRKISESRVIKN